MKDKLKPCPFCENITQDSEGNKYPYRKSGAKSTIVGYIKIRHRTGEPNEIH